MNSGMNSPAGHIEHAVRSAMIPSGLVLAGAVHDLGNLIQVATSAINIMARNVDMPAAHRKPILDRARSSLEQAGALAREAIGLVRGRSAPVEAANVDDCLNEVVSLFDTRSESGLSLLLEIEADLPEVQCSPIGLQCAVLNLLFNAREATLGRESLPITARAQRTSMAGSAVEISVEDRGIGMSPDTVARALDPFFTTKSDGTGGIGLPMVERFVREAGGSLSIESELGVGTKVSIRLSANLESLVPAGSLADWQS